MSDWFVRNARDGRWLDSPLGKFCEFEPEDGRFEQVGVNLNLLEPGEGMTMYHREAMQEDFLVLEGECLLLVEGQEVPLRKWDLFHCPPGVAHAIVGAGDGPSLVLAIGARGDNSVVYPADPVAQRHGVGVPADTDKPREAYAGMEFPSVEYQEGWLPD